MNYIPGDILKLKDGKVCTVVQILGNIYVCLDGVNPPKDLPPAEWEFCNVREKQVKNKIGNLNEKVLV